MGKYIDSEKLIAEIERMRGINKITFMEEEYKDYVKNDPVYSKLVKRNRDEKAYFTGR